MTVNPSPSARSGGDVQALLVCGAIVLIISMGVRHTFGLFLPFMTADNGWGREVFAFAIGLQNLMWGMAQPFTGALGDRFGARGVLISGAVLYALGLAGMALSTTPMVLALTCGVLIGVAHACTTYSTVFGVLGRRLSPEKRSYAMGVISAAGSFGQFIMMPITQPMIENMGWANTLLVFAVLVLFIILPSVRLNDAQEIAAKAAGPRQTIAEALREACTEKSYVLLTLGYFVCGFHVVFIGVHLPAYLKDADMPMHVATTALALLGLFNIFGSYGAGLLGNVIPQRYLLASIYFLRSVAMVIFLSVPLSPLSVYVFASVMGVLWLSTVPPTNGIIAKLFGVRYFSMLSGIAFFSHQIGGFIGVWFGGFWYDKAGNYDLTWALLVTMGIVATLINLPIIERPVARPAVQFSEAEGAR